MKVRDFTSFTAAVSSVFIIFDRTCRAWLSQPKHDNPFALRYASHSFPKGRAISTEFKAATIKAEATTFIRQQTESDDSAAAKPLESNLGKTIAEGTIVSCISGGLTAIRINEDFSDDNKSTITLTSDGLLPPTPLAVKIEVGDYQGKKALFPDGSVGVIIAHRPPLVFVYGSSFKPSLEGIVKIKETVAAVEVSSSTRIIDCFGQPIRALENVVDEDSPTEKLERPIFAPIPLVKDIALINNPVLTGITMIDTLASVGRGQNMLLIGHNIHSMRKLVEDYLNTQVKAGTSKCIYAATQENCQETMERFESLGIESQVLLVSTRNRTQMQGGQSDDALKAAEAVVVAATACSIGETYALQGKHALVVIDSIDLHKTFWDYTTRAMVDVFGVDSVVKSDRDGGASSEMRSFFSSLIQRSAQYSASRGGGSVTLLLLVSIPPESQEDDDTLFSAADFENAPSKVKARIDLLAKKQIPLTAATLRKINIPIPSALEGRRRYVLQHVDDLISMSDGQIWLDERLEESGRKPPVDPQRSVTRIGIGAKTESRADAPALRRIVEGLRLELSQTTDMLPGDHMNLATQLQNRRKLALLLSMYQEPGTGGRRLSESCVVLLAAQSGLLDKFVEQGALAGTDKGRSLIASLLDHVKLQVGDVMGNIDKTFDMTDAEQALLREAIRSHLK